MKIAVTGGTGHLGKNLLPFLVERGHSVVSIDKTPPATPFTPGIAHIQADVCDFGEFAASLRGCDALIHLAAFPSPLRHPDPVVYANNTVSSYNALSAAALVGIKRVCQASSINAIGGVYSRAPKYDYFPVDEQHATYAEDPYSLSKWVMEEQGNAFARRYEDMSIASMRFHWLVDKRETVLRPPGSDLTNVVKHLFAYTLLSDACDACLRALTADFKGHEAFYITSARTMMNEPSRAVAARYYPTVPIRGAFEGEASFFNTSKAERLLGWQPTG